MKGKVKIQITSKACNSVLPSSIHMQSIESIQYTTIRFHEGQYNLTQRLKAKSRQTDRVQYSNRQILSIHKQEMLNTIPPYVFVVCKYCNHSITQRLVNQNLDDKLMDGRAQADRYCRFISQYCFAIWP